MNTAAQVATGTTPQNCGCYATSHNDGVIYPVLCRAHAAQAEAILGHRVWKYTRYFETEQDALDRKAVIFGRWHPEGYGTIVHAVPVSRWWLVAGWWADSCE